MCLFWLDTLLLQSGPLPVGRISARVFSGRTSRQKAARRTGLEAYHSSASILLSARGAARLRADCRHGLAQPLLPGCCQPAPNPRGPRGYGGGLEDRDSARKGPGEPGFLGHKVQLVVWRARELPCSAKSKPTSKLCLLYSSHEKYRWFPTDPGH